MLDHGVGGVEERFVSVHFWVSLEWWAEVLNGGPLLLNGGPGC